MKKCKFYSVIAGANGAPVAKLWEGWTDIYFNYYKNEFGQWFAIEPSTGLSVTQAHTRKEAQKRATAPEILRKINEAVTQDKIQRFFELKTEAETCL